MTQAGLAEAVATSRPSVTAYEAGRISPTVRTLDRLLAGCGLQARVALEPLLADLDARVDALLCPPPALELEAMERLALSLDDSPEAAPLLPGRQPMRKGPVRWAFDGATALLLHGFAADALGLSVVAVLDEAARFWLRALQVRGRGPRETVYMSWLDGEPDELAAALDATCFSLRGFVQVRLVEELPPTLMVLPPEGTSPLPVVSVDEVERAHPVHGEALARLRQRRSRSPDVA